MRDIDLKIDDIWGLDLSMTGRAQLHRARPDFASMRWITGFHLTQLPPLNDDLYAHYVHVQSPWANIREYPSWHQHPQRMG